MPYKNHKNLLVWQKSMLLTQNIYLLTKSFPKEELYGLTSQIQRSAVSIPSNIAEGQGRDSDADFERFLKIATGSACELDTQIEIASMIGYISTEDKINVQQQIEEVLRILFGLRKKLNLKSKGDSSVTPTKN